jgi:hypothetical protein
MTVFDLLVCMLFGFFAGAATVAFIAEWKIAKIRLNLHRSFDSTIHKIADGYAEFDPYCAPEYANYLVRNNFKR